MVYFFRFSLPELWRAKKKVKDADLLFTLGAAANPLNTALLATSLLPHNNLFSGIFQELANGMTMIFFSKRRETMERKWLEENGNS